jgi:hypothetical protein
VGHLLLAIAAEDGSVSLTRVFGRVQPPYEGVGLLTATLASAAGAGGSRAPLQGQIRRAEGGQGNHDDGDVLPRVAADSDDEDG